MNDMPLGLIVIAHLYVRPGRDAAFQQFEAAAARIMERHGGQIERVVRPVAGAATGAVPTEIHVLWFPDRERFAAYRADPDLTALASLRESAIE